MEEAGRNALVQHERRTVTPLGREVPRRRLFKEKEIEEQPEQLEEASREEPVKGNEAEGSEIGSSERREVKEGNQESQEQK
ncbi:UNVERIFIED_CONTAM: hypothetical protein Slati_4602400 [Sesamum latifolium]|uniref:Uncharacterized protein n=1 Tax=Sesamum latifolium TaxID=2727402 RepID=A0AAW2S261_9LAMI